MPYIDLHKSKPFDEGTLFKLSIFEQYSKSWLPTFIMQDWIKEINIVDFFSGPGYDIAFKKGSPLLFLDTVEYHFQILKNKNKIINFYFNEFDKEKYENLQKNCKEFLDSNNHLKPYVNIKYYNADFNDIFNVIILQTQNQPSLYILDQNGIKFLNVDNFQKLFPLELTDFLFFVSSSYFNRFASDTGFKAHLDINLETLRSNPFKFIHRLVLEKYRSLIPKELGLRIFPFSIKKGANIYGIIFGSKHILGVQKFLEIAWRENQINGQANYDIDNDLEKQQKRLDFFNEGQKTTRIEDFKQNLEGFIKSKIRVSNEEIYYFTYGEGHIRKHADEKLRELKQKGLIIYSGHTKISWDAIKNNEIVYFNWL
jgi:three-Cys-motif partner protein